MAPIATTSTFDSTDNEAVLSAQEQAEQEAYEVGDRLVTEQETLLANKYRTPEELEEAYLELQRKLGERQAQEEPEEAEEAPEDEPEEALSVLSRLSEAADAGEFSEELLAELDQLSARDLANEFLAMREQLQGAPTYALTDTDVSEMQGIVGGPEQYQAMCQWAAENLSPEEVEVFDSVVTELQDPRAVYFAIKALHYQFQEATGYEPELLTGRSASNKGDIFESHAQLVAALNDPRYEKDPAYRASIEAKLERSGDLL